MDTGSHHGIQLYGHRSVVSATRWEIPTKKGSHSHGVQIPFLKASIFRKRILGPRQTETSDRKNKWMKVRSVNRENCLQAGDVTKLTTISTVGGDIDTAGTQMKTGVAYRN
jgi:hypothetical protein